MKRIITLVLVFCLALSLFACAKTQVSEEVTYGYYKPIEYEMSTLNKTQSDIFIAEVISSKELSGKTEFTNIINIALPAVLYTVKVKEVLWGISLTPDTVIQVIRYIDDDKSNPLWIGQLETGKTYLLSGLVQPYQNKVVIADMRVLSAQIDENDRLTALSATSKTLLEDISTYNNFIESEQTKILVQTKKATLPDAFFSFEESDQEAKINAIGVGNSVISEEKALKIVDKIQKDIIVSQAQKEK